VRDYPRSEGRASQCIERGLARCCWRKIPVASVVVLITENVQVARKPFLVPTAPGTHIR
jgi:hypothetical protein